MKETRFEISTTEGFLLFEDKDEETVRAYYAKGYDPAVALKSENLKVLGEVPKKALRRLGKAV